MVAPQILILLVMGSRPSFPANFMYVRLLLVVWRQTVTLLIRNIVGSIPTAYTNLIAE